MRCFQIILVLLVSAGFVGIMASCVNDNGDVVDFDVPLVFEPALHEAVKSDQKGTYSGDVPFGVSAAVLDLGSDWEYDGSKAESFLSDHKVERVGDLWFPQNKCNWPHISKSMTVMAYSPYGAATECNFINGVVFRDVNTLELEYPLLYSNSIENLRKDVYGGVVAVPFKHALSSLSIKLKKLVDISQRIVVSAVRFNGVKYKGDFRSIPYAEWKLQDDVAVLDFIDGSFDTSQSPETAGEQFLVIPQHLSGVFEVDFIYYTDAGTYINQTLSTRKVETYLEPGRHYSYTLSVGIDEVKFMLEVIDNHLQ